MTVPTCATCRWWQGDPAQLFAECRGSAPALAPGTEDTAAWPHVWHSDECGKHKPEPKDVGTCATCKHFEVTPDAELCGEVLPGEHPNYRSPGWCELGPQDSTHGSESCPYHKAYRGPKRLIDMLPEIDAALASESEE